MLDIQERKIGARSHKKPIDENCATHIIRHALGGVSGGQSKQYERLIDILQVGKYLEYYSVYGEIICFRYPQGEHVTTVTTSL